MVHCRFIMKKKVIILGSTGSIGVNALNCVKNSPDDFEVIGLSTHVNVELLLQQAAEFQPKVVAVTGRLLSDAEKSELKRLNIDYFDDRFALLSLQKEFQFDKDNPGVLVIIDEA